MCCQLINDGVAVKCFGLHFARNDVISERNCEPRFAAVWTTFPRNGFQLDLPDGIHRGLCTAGIGVQPAVASKSKRSIDAGMGTNNAFGLLHQHIFFIKTEVSAREHVNNGLLWFGFNEEFDTFVVVAKVDVSGADKDKNDPSHHKRHDRIANYGFHEVTKG